MAAPADHDDIGVEHRGHRYVTYPGHLGGNDRSALPDRLAVPHSRARQPLPAELHVACDAVPDERSAANGRAVRPAAVERAADRSTRTEAVGEDDPDEQRE